MIRSLLDLEVSYLDLRRIGPWLEREISTVAGSDFDHRFGEVELAVHELVTNQIDHAYRGVADPEERVHLELWFHDNLLWIQSTDRGEPFNENDRPVVGEKPTVRGYGIFIVEQLTESLTYERLGAANRWIASFGSESRPES